VSRPIFLWLAVSTIASMVGSPGAAAQSLHPDFTAGAVGLQPLAAAEVHDARPIGQAAPQQAGPDRIRGALWGGGIGLVAGGLLGGLTAGSDDDGGFGDSLVESAATGEAVLLGAVGGAVIGALLGATVFAPSHRSASHPAGAMRLSVHPMGAVIGVSGEVGIGR
jgi:hypothetical protein